MRNFLLPMFTLRFRSGRCFPPCPPLSPMARGRERKPMIAIFIFLSFFLTASIHAQTPPTIVFLTADVPATLTVADVESGQIQVTLRWKSVNTAGDTQAQLHAFILNDWQPLTKADGSPFLPTDSFSTLLQHPFNFAPPTFRLSLVDAAGNVLTQQFLTVPYRFDEASFQPQIVAFTSDRQTLDPAEIQSGNARLNVSWEIAGRWPTAHLLFEQILDDGNRVSIELPRENLWIPSKGQGVVAPVSPGTSSLIQIALRVVDVRDDRTLDDAVILLNLTSATTPPEQTTQVASVAIPTSFATDAPAPERQSQTSSTDEQIIANRPDYPIAGTLPTVFRFAFVPEPAAAGETVEIIWRVEGASSIAFDVLLPDGTRQNVMQAVPTLEGRYPVTLPEGAYYRLPFIMQVTTPAGDVLDMEKSIAMKCDVPYAFPYKIPALMCPEGAEQFVQGTFQEFEGGYLLRRADTDKIYVLYRGGRAFEIFPDDFEQNEVVTVTETPPANYFAPAGRLAKLWLSNAGVRARLGWAIAPENIYVMTLQHEQVSSNQFTTYLLWPDERLIFLRFALDDASGEFIGMGWGYVGR